MDLLSDIDNAVRQDQFKALFKKYGSAVISLVLILLLAVALYQGYQGWQHRQNIQATDALILALQKGEIADLTAFAAVAPATHKTIANLVAASREKDSAKKIIVFENIAADKAAPRDFRDLATIMKLRITSPANKEEAQKQADALQRIMADKRAAFALLARLDLSTLQARFLNDLAAARATLKPVFEGADLPPEFVARARALDQVYKQDMEQK